MTQNSKRTATLRVTKIPGWYTKLLSLSSLPIELTLMTTTSHDRHNQWAFGYLNINDCRCFSYSCSLGDKSYFTWPNWGHSDHRLSQSVEFANLPNQVSRDSRYCATILPSKLWSPYHHEVSGTVMITIFAQSSIGSRTRSNRTKSRLICEALDANAGISGPQHPFLK